MEWKKLESKVSELIELDNSADIKTVKVDCASIELTVGSEVYITPSSENDPKVKRILTENLNSLFQKVNLLY